MLYVENSVVLFKVTLLSARVLINIISMFGKQLNTKSLLYLEIYMFWRPNTRLKFISQIGLKYYGLSSDSFECIAFLNKVYVLSTHIIKCIGHKCRSQKSVNVRVGKIIRWDGCLALHAANYSKILCIPWTLPVIIL